MLYSSLLLPALLVAPAASVAAHVPRHPKRNHANVARSGSGANDVLIEARGPAPLPELKKPKAKRTVKKKRQEGQGSLCVVPGTNTTTRIGDGNWAGPTSTASSSSAQPTSTGGSGGGGNSATAWTLDEAWVRNSVTLDCVLPTKRSGRVR